MQPCRHKIKQSYCESIGIEIAVIHNLLKNLRVRAETGGGQIKLPLKVR